MKKKVFPILALIMLGTSLIFVDAARYPCRRAYNDGYGRYPRLGDLYTVQLPGQIPYNPTVPGSIDYYTEERLRNLVAGYGYDLQACEPEEGCVERLLRGGHFRVVLPGSTGGGGGGDVTIGDTNVNQPPPKGGIIKMKTPDDIIEKAMGLTYSHRQSINLKEFSPKSSSHFSIKPSQIARIKRCSSKLKGLLIGILITYIVILLSFLNIADTVIKPQHLANIVTHITKGVFTVIINLLHAYLPIITHLIKLIQTKEKPLLYKRKEGQQKPRWQIWAIARAPPN